MNGPDGLFAGQVVVVVGGGAGIGRAYSLELAREGGQVLVAGRGDSARQVANAIRATGGVAEPCIADVRDGSIIIDAALRRFGRIDGLIVNAGIVRDRSYARMSDEDWQEVVGVHLEGAHACTRAAWPHMIEQRYGRIMLTTSTAAVHGNFGQANYAAAKGGIIGLMRSLALEGMSRNILVNAVSPLAATGMSRDVLGPDLSARLKPDAVAPFVLAMMHPGSQETGAILETGGGWGGLLRWQRSAGLRLPAGNCTVAEVTARWAEVARFDEHADFPASGIETLQKAVGVDRVTTGADPRKILD
ncbi:SDR family NAD(P)-dependent oxidoreductase [Sphingobium sp.]|uniref:SDR family NAD(P)-dependent oxidoreductase n=1 Tax=Sphingobium sp. TaxID=1912891 RepID=UPI0028BE3E62|nr:SDR family NAD(P)-dependent oxidoreductase [Sphingobium sp.]